MREIKFRVWDKINKKIIYDGLDNSGQIFIHLNGEIEEIYTGNLQFVYRTDDYILMQFVGLKDKNNKEIYEGDIVEVYFQMNPLDKMKTSLEVIEDIRRIPHIGGSSRECKVIGNIYKNPELLK